MLTQSPLGACPPCLEHHTEVWKTPPMLKHIIMQDCRSCVLAPLIALEKSGSNEKPSSQKEMQVFKSYNLDVRQSGSQDWTQRDHFFLLEPIGSLGFFIKWLPKAQVLRLILSVFSSKNGVP